MKIRDNDTIAAIATPPGEGAIAVIRVSGNDAIGTVDRAFVGKRRLGDVPSHTVHFGKVFDAQGELVDEVLVTLFRAPHSYTGEDCVEISCHGGVYVANRVLETILSAGVRQADPGEFTKRAFLAGRIDLSQAEAVSDLIQARSQKAHWASVGQLEGKLSGFIGSLKSDLLRLCSLLELELDFSEEGLPLIQATEVRDQLLRVRTALKGLMDSYTMGRRYRDGVSVVLVGKPNSGKSSIFNAFLRESRAIVSPSPGTTRDYIEETIPLGGVLFRLVDTAGLRDVAEYVEAEGVQRAKSILTRSDIVILVVDFTESRTREAAVSILGGASLPGNLIIAYNKIDLVSGCNPGSSEFTHGGVKIIEVYLSAKNGAGLAILADKLSCCVGEDSHNGTVDFRITSRRHLTACTRADQSLAAALRSLESGMTNEFVALDVRQAVDALAEISGEVTTDDILNEVFGRFCIGK